MARVHAVAAAISLACMSAGCSDLSSFRESLGEKLAAPDSGILPPTVGTVTEVNHKLRDLPPPVSPVAVAVYGYQDQTGQFKPADNVQTLSRAVTQGATSILLKALQDAGEGRWFTVVERERLDNLLKERRIIADMRQRYLGETEVNPGALPPLLFAGILLDGGIIGYDSNTKTGGAGAKYFGIGGDVKYREDTVTVYLRAISVKTGQVLVSVVANKVILSYSVQGSVFRFVSFNRLLEAEGGFSNNEPNQLAVQQAIEKAVLTFIVEGTARGLWGFKDKAFESKIIDDYEMRYLASAREAASVPVPNGTPAATALAANAAQKAGPRRAAAAKPPVPQRQAALAQAQPATSAAPLRTASVQGLNIAPAGSNVPAVYPQQRGGPAPAPNTTVAQKVVVQRPTLDDEVGINPR